MKNAPLAVKQYVDRQLYWLRRELRPTFHISVRLGNTDPRNLLDILRGFSGQTGLGERYDKSEEAV